MIKAVFGYFLLRCRRFLQTVKGVSTRNICAVFCVSGNSDEYLRKGALIAIRSMRRTNPNIPICIIYCNLSDEQKALFGDCELIEGNVDGYQKSASSKTARPDIDKSIFLRFNIDKLSNYDFVIYLDSDLVVLSDITDIFDHKAPILCRPMPGYPLSSQFLSKNDLVLREGLSTNLKAVNAGVMGIDLSYWNRSSFVTSIIQKISKYGWDEFIFNDQSLLNLVGYVKGAIGYLPIVYNFMMWPDVFELKKTYRMKLNHLGLMAPDTGEGLAKIVHWNGPLKPWHEEFLSLPEEAKAASFGQCYEQFVN